MDRLTLFVVGLCLSQLIWTEIAANSMAKSTDKLTKKLTRELSNTLERQRRDQHGEVSKQVYSCGHGAVIHVKPGESVGITSPEFGTSSVYPNNYACDWNFKAEPGQTLQLSFESFELERSQYCNERDFVDVHETVDDVYVSLFCGTELPEPFQTQGNTLIVKFFSDQSIAGAGFSATVVLVESGSTCDHTFTEEGSIQYPYHLDTYEDNAQCGWTIEAPEGKFVRLEFISIDIEVDGTCRYDSLCGFEEDGSSLGCVCSQTIPEPIVTPGNMIALQFTSDDSVDGGGFKLNFTFTDEGPELPVTPTTTPTSGNACDETQPAVLTNSSGFVESPMIDSSSTDTYYPYNADCSWLIKLDEGSRVQIHFDKFDLESGSNCAYDQLDIYDGNNDEAPLIERLCGHNLPGDSISSGNEMFIQFHSDHIVSKPGFHLTYSQLETTVVANGNAEIACGSDQPHMLTGTSGTITSPADEDGKYPGNSDCTWLITVPKDMRVNVHVTDLSLESYDCAYDYIVFHDGATTSYPELEKVCGDDFAGNLLSSGSEMMIHFVSDDMLHQTGFTLEYSAKTGDDITPGGDGDGGEGTGSIEDTTCGIPDIEPSMAMSRVVGGTYAVPGSWPWQISLVRHQSYHSCGGSILTKRWAITAAHCVVDGSGNAVSVSTMHVKVGEFDFNVAEGFEATHQVINVIVHDDYAPYSNNNNDVALLELDTDIEYNSRVKPICLPNKDITTLTDCAITGWGETEDYAQDNQKLNQAFVPIISNDACNGDDYYDGVITSQMVCAGYETGGIDTCQGDSGGPMVCLSASQQWVLHGITSWGYGCAEHKKPGVYARVNALMDFIQKHVPNAQIVS